MDEKQQILFDPRTSSLCSAMINPTELDPTAKNLLRRLTDVEKRAIKAFLADAYYSHEINPADYQFLMNKVDNG